jgi:glutathione S-transferase
MNLHLYAHPFSSYCQKVLIALYEYAIPFELKLLGPEAPDNFAELTRLWPLQRFPVLVDADHTVMEASIIVEHLGLYHAGTAALLPADPKLALETRFMDRFFDNYVMTPMQRIVADGMRAPADRDAQTVAEARRLLESAYSWLEGRMAAKEWAADAAFSLADCAAAPSLFYADWAHRIEERFPHVRAYRPGCCRAPPSLAPSMRPVPIVTFFPSGRRTVTERILRPAQAQPSWPRRHRSRTPGS